jgi:misacylated tRNA(Ala) deacylase
MKTELLYLKDSYLKEWEATVVSAKGKFIVLDKSAFYYTSGGQPCDHGTINDYRVVFGGKFNGEISYEVDREGLKEGDKVQCKLDWERRYKLMQMHTTAHILAGIVHDKTGALITGNQLDVEKSRIDFALENFDRSVMDSVIDEGNKVVSEGHAVNVKFLSRDEADKMPQLSKLAKGLSAEIKEVRILEIEGVDEQADGGTHVKNTSEIGKISLLKVDNKGKSNRRFSFGVE